MKELLRLRLAIMSREEISLIFSISMVKWPLLHLSAVSAHKRGKWHFVYFIDPIDSSVCSFKQREL